MCKSCKMDPRDVQILRERQGARSPEYGEVEVNYKPKTKVGKNAKKKNYPGCPGNDGGKHVYVWTEEFQKETLFSRFYGFNERQSLVCCGCLHVKNSKDSDAYEKRKSREWNKRYGNREFTVKRGAPVSRFGRGPSYSWWNWENYDEEYRAYRKDYITKHGWNSYVYGF